MYPDHHRKVPASCLLSSISAPMKFAKESLPAPLSLIVCIGASVWMLMARAHKAELASGQVLRLKKQDLLSP